MYGSEEVLALHRSTMHGDAPVHPDQLLSFRPLDPTNRPAPLKTYTGAASEPLPRQLLPSALPAVDVLSGRRGPATALDDELLGTLLFLAAGVTRGVDRGGEVTWFRTAMSAGNLHPVEVYVVGRDVAHYHPLEHALVPVRRGVDAGTDDAGGATLVLTGIPFRTCWKYGERGWRHLWWDAGAMLANLLAAADAHGVPAQVLMGFPDDAVAALVGVDGVDEVPLAVVRLGAGDVGEVALPPADSLSPLMAEAQPIARRVLRFPMVVAAQHATVLAAGDVRSWRQASSDASQSASASVDPPVGPADAADRIEDVILRRGSTRLFRHQQAPNALLEWGLASAARSVPLDAATGALVEHLVNVHDVVDAEAGGYRFTPTGGFEGRTRIDDPRGAGARLCLDQPLGGDSSYTVFHAAALGPLLDALGGRGYRAAQLEAGIAAGRLALAAVATGHGATGLTFYDRLVSQYFGTESAPLLATAVGVPETAPAPSGRPGQPVRLAGYDRVMARVAAGLRRR